MSCAIGINTEPVQMKLRNRLCQECGQPFQATQPALFCGRVCRVTFNNRRRARGAMLYDFLMAQAYANVPDDGIVGRLLTAFRERDAQARSGRPSWQPNEMARMEVPFGYRDDR